MTTKFFWGFLAAICLTTGMVVAQEATSSNNLDDLQSLTQFSLLDGGSYLGVYAEDINRENMARYNLSHPRGVGVTSVAKDSPAEKAGLRKDDVILRVDGENITSVRKLNRLISEIAPDQTVKVSISRGGAEQELSATVTKRQNTFAHLEGFGGDTAKLWKWDGPLFSGDGNFTLAFANSRRLGISTTNLTKQLADFFGVPGGKGVLVTSVTEEDPAAKAGIKAGDVITSIDGEAVDSPGDISRIINAKKEGEVTVTLIRNKSQQSIRLTPKEGQAFPSRTIVRPQIGRQIVIPRVEFPPFPEVNITMPRIEVQAVPAINIQLPTIRVTPKAKVVKGTSHPI